MLPPYLQTVVTVLCTLLASAGFWTFLDKRAERKKKSQEEIMDDKIKKAVAERVEAQKLQNEILLGLAHDLIISRGMECIERGYISKDEYENLNDYLYTPYEKMGGNGSAKRVMEDVRKLPLK